MGIRFDSKIEGDYYLKLLDDKAKDKIINFELQPEFVLQEGFTRDNKKYKPIVYVGDFLVYHLNGTQEVVDIKGMATPEAKLKRKMFLYRCKDYKLTWLCWIVKYGGWIDYFELQKKRAEQKKIKNKAAIL